MNAIEFDWFDAFSDVPFKGNGCAVVYDNGEWDAATCLAFTRETKLSECTFVAPSDVADVRVRYFLQSHEIPFAGHPTIATAASLFERGLISEEAKFETGAGIIPIKCEGNLVTMRQIAPIFGQEIDGKLVVASLGLSENDLLDTPQFVSTGLPFIITLLKDRAALERAKLNLEKLEAMRAQYGLEGFTEPYLCILEARGTTGRLLMPPPNPPEDPFTGSASGAMAAYLWKRGHLACQTHTHFQGHMLDREGKAELTCIHSGDEITGIGVSGSARLVMRGQVYP